MSLSNERTLALAFIIPLATIGVGTVLFCAGFLYYQDRKPVKPLVPAVHKPDPVYVAASACAGWKDVKSLEQFMRLRHAGDGEAAKKLYMQEVLAGRMKLIEKGTILTWEDSTIRGCWQVRPQGNPDFFWVMKSQVADISGEPEKTVAISLPKPATKTTVENRRGVVKAGGFLGCYDVTDMEEMVSLHRQKKTAEYATIYKQHVADKTAVVLTAGDAVTVIESRDTGVCKVLIGPAKRQYWMSEAGVVPE